MNNVSPVSNGIVVEYYTLVGEIANATLHTKGDLQMQFRFGPEGRTYVRVADGTTFHRLIHLRADSDGTAVFCVSDDPATDEQLGNNAKNTYRVTRFDGRIETVRGFDEADAICACEGGPSYADINSVERIG